MAAVRFGMEAKNARKKLRRCPLVVGRDDGVVEGDGHGKTSRCRLPQTYRSRQTIDRFYRLLREGRDCGIPSRLKTGSGQTQSSCQRRRDERSAPLRLVDGATDGKEPALSARRRPPSFLFRECPQEILQRPFSGVFRSCLGLVSFLADSDSHWFAATP